MPIDKEKANARHKRWLENSGRERIDVTFLPGTKEKVKTAAAVAGVSMAVWVQSAIDEKLEREKE